MSTATKLTYLNDTKGLLKDSINSLGGEITSQTTFRQYATELDSIYANLPKVSGTGSILSLSPTLKGRLGIVPKGDTYQKTNLYNNDIEQGAISDGANVSANNRIRTAGYIEVVPSTQLYIGFSGCDDIYVSYYNSSKTFVSAYGWATGNSNISIPANIYYIRVAFRKNDNSNITPSSISNVQIGNVPNPDYPQDIQSVTGNQVVSVTGKNLFENAKENKYFNNSYDFITQNGASTTNYIPAKEGDIFTISCENYSNGIVIASFDENYNCLLRSATNGTSISHTCPTNTKYIIGSNYVYSNNPTQLEKGSTATTYEPYQNQEYEINLGTIELNKIGDYQDYITGTPDNWSIKRKIGSVVLDGTEDWNDRPNYTYADRFVYGGSIERVANVGYSNYFIIKSASNNDYPYLSINGTQTVINFSEKGTTTLAQFKTWLSTHNTEVDYVLANEITEPITNQEIINQLNEIYYLQSYNGTTNITITSEDLELIMTASALKGDTQ